MSVSFFPRLGLAAIGACLALNGCDTAPTTLGHAEGVVGSEGGAVAISTGSAAGTRIDIPSGAVDGATHFSIDATTTADHLAAGLHAIGPVITFGPEGTSFALPVHITLPATAEPMVVLTRPHGDTVWARVDGAVWDAANGVVVADVMHFSDFVPVERDTTSDDASTSIDAGPPIVFDSGIDCSDPRFAGYPVCVTGYECDLFTGGCAAGYANCYPPDDTTSHGRCSSAGSASLGQACTFEGYDHETECTGDLRCDATTIGATGACRPVCDATHACYDDGITIVECQYDRDGAAFGFCEPVGMHCRPTETPETSCTDGIDDDCDTLVDCADWDCRLDPACAVSTCDALADSGCAAGQHCGLHTVDATVDSTVVSACFANGSGTAGASCNTGADCGDGLTCAAITGSSSGAGEETHWYFTSFEGYFTRGGGLCVQLCAGGDWSASSCTGGEICHQIENVGAPSGFGACYAPRSGS